MPFNGRKNWKSGVIMKKITFGILVATGLGLAVAAAPPKVKAESVLNVGVLTCKQIPGKSINLLIHSVAMVDCVFSNSAGKERYKGESGIGLGIDLEWNASKTIAYTVVTAGAEVQMGTYALAGKYAGGRASVAAGIGAGAQVLVGGGDKGISLQPIGLEGSTGLGASVGLGYLYLEPSR